MLVTLHELRAEMHARTEQPPPELLGRIIKLLISLTNAHSLHSSSRRSSFPTLSVAGELHRLIPLRP